MKKAAVGVDIGGTSVKLGLVDRSGRVLDRTDFLTRAYPKKKQLLDALAGAISRHLAAARKRGLETAGVGIGAPGAIDVDRGFVYFFPNIKGWENTPLRAILQKKLRTPVRIDNDASAMAWAEFCFGAGRGAKNMIGLTLGTGIGGGIVTDGKLFHGPHFSAAEIGHMTVDLNGPLCACGNRGCIEAFVGNGYFVREARRGLKAGGKGLLRKWVFDERRELTPKLIEDAAKVGDAYSKECWQRAGTALGTLLAGLCNVLNPDRIILGGGMAKAGPLLFKPMERALRKKAFPIASRFVKVLPAVLGTDAGLIGAAALAFPNDKR